MPHPASPRRTPAQNTPTPRRLCRAIALALGTALPALPSAAVELTWTGLFGSPFWSARFFGTSNWNGGGVPQSGDSLLFAGSDGLVNQNDYVGLSLAHLSFAAGAGAFTLNGLVPTQETRLTVTGDITNRSSHLQTINLAMDARGTQPQIWNGGTHGLVINGSAYFADDTWVELANQTRLNSSQKLQVGINGGSTLMITGGSAINSSGALLGNGLGSSGRVRLTGSGTQWVNSGDLRVGGAGTGNLRIENGAQVRNQTAWIAGSPNSLVVVTGPGSRWDTTGRLEVGDNGGQALQVFATAVVSSGSTFVGSTGSTALIEVGEPGSRLETDFLGVGANGRLHVTYGGALVSSEAWIGQDTSGESTVVLAYGNASWQNEGALAVGNGGGKGSLTILQGSTVSTQTLNVTTTGTLNLNGGTLQMESATVDGAGQFNWNSGTVRFSKAGATLGAGSFLLDSTTTIGTDRTLEFAHSFAVGSGNHLQLTGGTLGGTGSLLNDGQLTGFGALAGSGGFTNSGVLVQTGGNMVLSNTGANRNTGNWDMALGQQLQLAGATLANHGTLNLNGGSVGGTGTLTNAAGGTVTGRGAIGSLFSNAGVLALESGNTTVGSAFNNSGQIQLASNTATLAGGLVSNSGTLEGRGRVNNAINNTGTVEALGGTLTLAGAVNNTGNGVMAAGTGTKLVVLQGLAHNGAHIQLAGGTFDNNGAALTNDVNGTISGQGTLRGSALVNDGRILLASGPTAVHADMRTTSGSQIILSGQSNTAFYGPVEVQSGAELRVSQGSVATFFGMVNQRSGALLTGSGNKYYEGGLAIGNSPGLGVDAGNVTFGVSNIYSAEVAGTSPGDGLGNGIQFDRYVVGGTLTFGGTLKLVALNGFAPQAGQSFDLFDWGSSQGQFSSLDFAAAPLAAGLAWDASRLYVDGSLQVAAVPEPASTALLLAGLVVVGAAARRKPAG